MTPQDKSAPAEAGQQSTTVEAERIGPRERRRVLRGAAIGQFVEWFDFLIYGISSPALAHHYFSRSSESALLGTLAIFAVGFVVRPLGGVVFGALADRAGRRKILSITILTMGAATVLSGLLPTYASIGIAAPILLLVVRLVQGLAAGGEMSGLGPLVTESAPPGRRGRWIGVAFAAGSLPPALGGFLVLGLNLWFGTDGYLGWAWRLPFVIAGVLAVVGLFIRLRVEESREFLRLAQADEVAAAPVREVLRRHFRPVVTVCLLISVVSVSQYTVQTYMATYLSKVIGLAAAPALLSTAIAVVVIAAILPIAGALADRFGRKALMMAGAILLAVLAAPAFLLMTAGTFGSALAGQLLLSLGIGVYGGGAFVTLFELFPTRVRSTGIGIAYNVGYAVFGGTAAFIAQLLVSLTGSAVAPAWYIVLLGVVGVAVVAVAPETKPTVTHECAAEHAVRR